MCFFFLFNRFVEKYFEMKNEMKSRGGTEDELFDTVTRTLKLAGINLRKKAPKTCKLIQTIFDFNLKDSSSPFKNTQICISV